MLLGRYWNHEPTPRPAPWTCTVDLTVGDQHGRNEVSYQAPTPAPMDVVATYSYAAGKLESIHTTHVTPTPAPIADPIATPSWTECRCPTPTGRRAARTSD